MVALTHHAARLYAAAKALITPKVRPHRDGSRRDNRRTMRVYDLVALKGNGAKGNGGFTHATTVGGRLDLVKNGTNYRADKLVTSGRVRLANG